MDYKAYILKALKAESNVFGKVIQLVHVESLLFQPDAYAHLLECLKNGQLPTSTIPDQREIGFREYIEVYSITAENGDTYLATFYDSDALEQDPQLIDLIPVRS